MKSYINILLGILLLFVPTIGLACVYEPSLLETYERSELVLRGSIVKAPPPNTDKRNEVVVTVKKVVKWDYQKEQIALLDSYIYCGSDFTENFKLETNNEYMFFVYKGIDSENIYWSCNIPYSSIIQNVIDSKTTKDYLKYSLYLNLTMFLLLLLILVKKLKMKSKSYNIKKNTKLWEVD